MLSEDDARHLLDELCVEFGFCLPPDERARLATAPPDDVEAITRAVFLAEGLPPERASRRIYREVRDSVAAAFRRAGA